MANLDIETTQHVKINYRAAGVSDRLIAFFLDALIIFIYLVVTITLMSNLAGDSAVWLIVLLVIPAIFYHLGCELLFEGQSIGKKALQIKVVKKDGTPADLGSYLLRWLFRLLEITMTTGSVAFLAIMFNGKGQRLGDMAAGTAVVKVKKRTNLSDTLYKEIEEEYQPKYPQVEVLEDSDIAVVNDILASREEYDYRTFLKLALQTRKALQRKMKISVPKEEDAIDFLKTIMKDYNAVHR